MSNANITVRFAGAQIPITTDIWKNVKTIKRAIDWAHNSNVEYLVTPEGSLSGYNSDFIEQAGGIENIKSALSEVEIYAQEKNVGLCLGTLFINEEDLGFLKRNEIRFYNPNGSFVDSIYKRMLISTDKVIPGTETNVLKLSTSNGTLTVGGLICNDAWGEEPTTGKTIGRIAMQEMTNLGAQLCIHATNGFRGDDIGDEPAQQLFRDFHETHLRMIAKTHIPILTVDNCNDIFGNPYNGQTSTPSGVISTTGEWLVQAPRVGEQYFYYDFNFEDEDIKQLFGEFECQ